VNANVNIAKEFSRHPAGRYRTDGPFPGELCRKKLLVPPLAAGNEIVVELDGTRGYGSSFLEEAFGGLIREEGFDEPTLRARMRLESSDPALIEEIWGYISEAQQERQS
jgi:hypothetical protein